MALMTRSRQSMPNTSKIFSMSYFFSSIALFVRVVQFVFTLNFTNFELLTALCEPDYEADNDRENREYVSDGYTDIHCCLNRACRFRIASDCLKRLGNQNTETDAGADNSEPYDDCHTSYFFYFNVHNFELTFFRPY